MELASNFYRELSSNDGPPNLFVGIESAIRNLSAKYMLYIISSSSTGNIKRVLNHYGLGKYFVDVCGQDKMKDIHKSDPKFVLIPMGKWELRKDSTISIGDTVDEITAGHKAGLRTIACSWGWQDRKLLQEAKPGFLVDSPEQLNKAATTLFSKQQRVEERLK